MIQQLRQAIRDDGRSLNKLAEAAGLDAGRLSRFLRGERDINFEAGCQIADAVGIRFVMPNRPAGGGPKPPGDTTSAAARAPGRSRASATLKRESRRGR